MNSSPVLSAITSLAFTSVLEGATNPAGMAVADLLPDGSVQDADGAVKAVAITGLNTSLGQWQYSLASGQPWLTVAADQINNTAHPLALLLGPTAQLRLLPFADLAGSLNEAVTLRAWDMSSGTQGSYVPIVGGAGSAFSSTSGSASITVAAVNDAPVFTAGGSGAPLLLPVGAGGDTAQAVALQPDGKILVAGYSFNGSNNDFSVLRLHADGSLDTSFNGTGRALIPVGSGDDFATCIAVQADGKVLLLGHSSSGNHSDLSLVRLNADGSVDASFGSAGGVVIAGTVNAYGRAISVQGDGRILVAGSGAAAGTAADLMLRLNADGSLDASLDAAARALVSLPDADPHYARQPDGKVLVAGTRFNGSNDDFSLSRFHADGSPDTRFGINLLSSLGGTAAYTVGAAPVALDASVAVYDAELAALNGGLGNYSGASISLSRRGGAQPDDLFSARGSLSFVDGKAVLAGTEVGTVSNSAGALHIQFNANATQTRVDQVLSSLAFANSNEATPASITLDWRFDDGNTTIQGTGGAQAATGSTTLTVTSVNDAGQISFDAIAPVEGLALKAQVSDPDGLGPVSYRWYADGQLITGAQQATYTPVMADLGKLLSVTAQYLDGQGTAETLHLTASAAVVETQGPRPVADELAVRMGKTATADVLANDADPQGDTLTLVLARPGAHGSVAVVGNQLVYTAAAGYVGTDSVSYTVRDSDGHESTGQVAVLVASTKGLGTAGADTLKGGNGDDVLVGLAGNDKLSGGQGGDQLYGGAGNDTLAGGSGKDRLFGGDGVDVFEVGYGDLDEDTLDGGSGVDTLRLTSTTPVKTGFTHQGLEVLDMGGFKLFVNTSSAVDFSGLALENGAAIVGNALDNAITGTEGNDLLMGGAGKDELRGSGGDDTLVGGAGADTLSGGEGDDVFQAGASALSGDSISGDAGTDTLQFTADVRLGAGFSMRGVERLDMGGRKLFVQTTAAVDLSAMELLRAGAIVGNIADNTITGTRGDDDIDGGSGNDRLNGGLGNDVLTGGRGNDVFVFDTALDASHNVDTLRAFGAKGGTNGTDQIYLDRVIFGALEGAGTTLSAAQFLSRAGGLAQTSDQRIILDATNNKLFYDADGSGTDYAGEHFATLLGMTGKLDASNFVLGPKPVDATAPPSPTPPRPTTPPG